MRFSSTHRRSAASAAALLALVFSFASPAFAGGGGKGDSKGSRATVTENTDTNDDGTPNNVADSGDDRHPSGKDRSVENGGSGNQGASTSDPDGASNGGADKPDGAGGIDAADQDGNNGCGNDDDFEDDNNGWCGRHPQKIDTGFEVAEEHECTRAMPAGAAKDDECGKPEVEGKTQKETEVEGETVVRVITQTNNTCPHADARPTGGVMPAGCTTLGTVATAASVAPGAVLASELTNAPRPEAQVLGLEIERSPVPAAVAASGGVAAAGTSVLGAVLARTGFSLTLTALAVALGLLAIGFALKRADR
ncbi:MAG TPA: hypothetical protein VM143_18530 [Acidimicrobiales bacterium]|nr:hypothetical protein [Acidimicrobiales bacterium]